MLANGDGASVSPLARALSPELRWAAELDQLPVVRVRIDSIRSADSPRLGGISPDYIRQLARSEQELPPIVVHRASRRIVDGMHRVRAALLRGEDEIDARFFDGAERDAFVLAVRLNAAHGLPLTRTDRRAAATRIIRSHPQWSDRMIAAAAGLSPKTVGAIRRRLSGELPQSNTRVGHDGRARPVDTSDGRRLAGELISHNPRASLREVARAAGISPATVRSVRERINRGESPVLSRPPDVTARPGVTELLPILSRDPSLRFNEHGRALL